MQGDEDHDPRSRGHRSWNRFWESARSSRLNYVQAEHFVKALEHHVELHPNWRVLDFGCGFGFTAGLIAPRVASVSVWDAAANMRALARDHLAAHDNVEVLDLATPTELPRLAGFDLVVVNSVVQYMSANELRNWLAAWRDWLTPGGKLVLSDLIPGGYEVWRDIPAVLLFSLRRGILFHAVIEGVREGRRYRRVHSAVPLLTIDPDELTQQAAELGLDTEVLTESLTTHPRRFSVVLTPR